MGYLADAYKAICEFDRLAKNPFSDPAKRTKTLREANEALEALLHQRTLKIRMPNSTDV